MKKTYYILLPIYIAFFVILTTYEVLHPPFSQDSVKIGDYEVQVSTTPSVPDVGKDTTIHFRVLDQNGNQVDNARMGLSVYYRNELVKEVPMANYPGSWDMDYVFNEPGNYVFRLSLLDLNTDNISSYAFNLSTLSLYQTIFFVIILAGATAAVGIILAIVIYQRKTKPKFR